MQGRRHQGSRCEEGAISVMAAILVVATVMATSLAVDVGRVTFTSRDQQGVTDRSVLDSLHQLGDAIPIGATAAQVHQAVADSVDVTLAGNEDGSSVGTTADGRHPDIIEVGYVDPATCPAPQYFCVVHDQDGPGPSYGHYDPAPGSGRSITTVRVATSSQVDFVFGFLDSKGHRDVVKEAIGTNRRPHDDCPPPPSPDPCLLDAEAGISVRSRLLEFNSDDSELLGDLVAGLIGADPAQLSLVGFDGLADAELPLGVLGDAGANVGSVDQLLDSQVRLADLFTAMASADSVVGTSAQTALGELAAEVDPDLTVTVAHMLAATTEDPEALLTAVVDAQTLVMHAAMNAAVANGTNFLDLGVSGSDLFGLDGLFDVDADLTVVEGPQMAYGRVAWDESTGRYETIARTAQVELDVGLELATSRAEELLGPLVDLLDAVLCLPVLGLLTCPSSQSVSLSIGAARAEAELAGIECFDPISDSDITTIVTSDALVAEVDGDQQELVASRGSGEVVVIPEVPGEGTTSVDDTTLTDIAVLDEALQPLLDLLGIGTGTAYVAAHEVRCDVPVLLPNELPGVS